MTLRSLEFRCCDCIESRTKYKYDGFWGTEDCYFYSPESITVHLSTGASVENVHFESCYPSCVNSFDELELRFERIDDTYKKIPMRHFFTCNAMDIVALETLETDYRRIDGGQ